MKTTLLSIITAKIDAQILRILSVLLVSIVLLHPLAHGQNAKEVPPDSIKYAGSLYRRVMPKPEYPKVVGYLSFILPLETLQSGNFTPNFDHHTSNIGFPIGVNVLYSDHFGFSYEITPNIEATDGSSKMSKILFDPGTMFRFDHGFTIITRLAFETSGRYGFTPVFNQIYARNAEAYSIGLNLQIGFIFN
jgi:hypothetical protein